MFLESTFLHVQVLNSQECYCWKLKKMANIAVSGVSWFVLRKRIYCNLVFFLCFLFCLCVCWCFKPQYYLFICIFNSKSNGGRNVFLMLGNCNVPVRTHSWGFTACPAAVYVKNKQTDSDLVESYWACSVLYWALWLFGGWAANFLRLLKHFHLWMHRCFLFFVFFFFFFPRKWLLTIFFSFNIIGNFQFSFHYSYWGTALVQLVALFPLGITLSIMLRQTTSHPFFL